MTEVKERKARKKHRGINLRLPPELKDAIEKDAFEQRTNQQAVIVRLLGRHYQVDVNDFVSDRRTVPFGGGRPTHRD